MRILIVEDHLMFREVLRKVCAEELRHDVAGEAGDGRAAVALALTTSPELVLLDLHLPQLDGFEVVEALRKFAPEIRILVLSSHCDEFTVWRVERARVLGFVDKNTNTVAALKEAITAASQGRAYFSETFKRVKAARIGNPESFDKVLTDRELDVVAHLGASFNDDEIAQRLHLSASTVAKHRFNALRKLNLQGTSELMRYARDHGLTPSPPSAGGGAVRP